MFRLVVVALVLAAGVLWPAQASAVSVFASRDAQRAVVLHYEPLVAADTDDEQDFYLYDEDGGLELLSVGPIGGNGDFPANFSTNTTPDLDTVFFSTAEKLVAADADGVMDVYRRDVEANTTTLMTPGTAAPIQFGTVSDDGSKLVFVTAESLAGDADGGDLDVFLSNGTALTLLSPQRAGEPSRDVYSFGLYTNSDASRVFFSSSEELTPDDTDGIYDDVYEWSSGTLKRISTGPTDPNGSSLTNIVSPLRGRIDGDSVFFTSNEQLTGDDGDATTDVFERDGTTTTRWETGGGVPFVDGEGTQLVFNSLTALGDGDVDTASDVYLATGPSTYTRISKGGGGNANIPAHHWGNQSSTPDFAVHTFSSGEALAAPDADDDDDAFRWQSGALTLASAPPTSQAGTTARPSGSPTTAATSTSSRTSSLTPQDTDTAFDIYSRAGSTTTLISTGPGQAGPPHQAYSVQPAPDGSRVFFMTDEQLLAEDVDDEEEDGYLRIGAELRMVTRRATPPPPREVADPVVGSRFSSAIFEVDGRPVHVFRAGEVGGCLSIDVETVIASGTGSLSNVKLHLDPKGDAPPQPFNMEDRGGGVWRVLGVGCFPRGTSDLVVCYDLTEGDQQQSFCITIGGVVLIDPQGVVYDKQAFDQALAAGRTEEQARNESAISGAVVTLQRSDGGVFGNVLSGDPGIAPNVNPQTTGADGLFRWDVSEGAYRVVVVRDGYDTVTSREVVIPPPVLDLHIAMNRLGAGGPPPGLPDVPNARDETPPSVAACGARTLRPDRRRRLKVCLLSSEAVTGTVAVAARKPKRGTPKRRRFTARLAAKRFTAPASRRVSVAFRLSARQVATLRRARRATVVLTVVATDAAGNRVRVTLPRTLVPPRRR